MKIVDNSLNKEMSFMHLKNGEVFKYENRILIKVSHLEEDEFNAYDFSKGRLTKFSRDSMVIYVPSELVLHERGWGEE